MAISSWSLIVALCCSLLASIACGQSVAPGDEDPTCFNTSFRVPVPPQQKILLDTQNYKELELLSLDGMTGIWKSENFDGKVTDGVNYNVSSKSNQTMIISKFNSSFYLHSGGIMLKQTSVSISC